SACGVPEKELPPMHLADAREKRRGHPEHRDEAREEDRLAAVTPEEAFGPWQHSGSVMLEETPALQQPPPANPAHPVTDVVTDDRGHGGDRDHRDDAHVAAGSEHARRRQRRLAR